MTAFRTLAALSVTVVAAACASPEPMTAGPSSPGAVPSSHHAGATATAPMAAMEPRAHAMHEMHRKMKNAGSAAERQALMADHMTAMQGGMAMMKKMHATHAAAGSAEGKGMQVDMAEHHRTMADHMAMMQLMMDMMMDRMPAATAAP